MCRSALDKLMLQEQVIPVEFGQGLDTKTDPKSVVAGKFLRLENGVFTAPKRIAKRNGYTSTGTSTAPTMVHSYNNELLKSDSGTLYSWSSNQSAWISKGSYTSVELSRSIVSSSNSATGITDVAILNNYALYGWSDVTGDIYGTVVDLSTGDILSNFKVYSNGSANIQQVNCVLLAGTTLAITYRKGGGEYGARTVSFPGSGVITFSAETVITSGFTVGFDIIETTTGAAFVYAQSGTPGITTATLSTSLVVTTVTRAVTVGLSAVVSISKTSNGNIWVYWTEATDDGAGNLTALTIYYAVYSATLVQVLTRTSIVATATPYYVSSMVSKSDSAIQQTLYYGLFKTNNNGAKHEVEYSNYITITSTGTVGAATLFSNGVVPFSHPFTVGSNIYSVFVYRSSDFTVATSAAGGGSSGIGSGIQCTFFVVELTNLQSPPYVVARFGSGVANTYAVYGLVAKPNVATFSSSKFYFGCGLTVQESALPSVVFVTGPVTAFSYLFDFNGANSYSAKNAGGIAVLNGATTHVYDGSACSEFGFHLFPEITNLTEAGVGGSIPDGTYSYIAIFQWIDAQGNLHQSTPSFAKSITCAAGTGTSKVTATVTTNFLTRKTNSSVAIYRTTNGGTIYHLVTDIILLTSASPTTNAIVTFGDTLSDTSIASREISYTSPGSSVLDNNTPPPSMLMVAHNNRLWFVDSEDPNTIWYTKSSQLLVGLSPSGFLTEQIDPKLGIITALSEMDEKLIILKDSGVYIQSGDGFNDNGSGSTLSFPQVVPSDVGCDQMKSVVSTPEGVMFHSPNGIYILTRALNVAYIGMEVESYNSQTITDARLIKGKSQIRFLCSSGLTLVYDYIFKQWSTFTGHTGVSATNWNNTYVYTNGSNVLQETSGVYSDNGSAFSLLAQTSWLALAGVQGFQRVKRLIMLGDFINGNSAAHNLSISAAYDFSTTFQTAITYAFGAALGSGVFQYRERLPIQKCDTISLLIQETTTGSSAEYIDLTNISFEAGVKKGVNKLRGQQSVG
jgi:hypothetical protein